MAAQTKPERTCRDCAMDAAVDEDRCFACLRDFYIRERRMLARAKGVRNA